MSVPGQVSHLVKPGPPAHSSLTSLGLHTGSNASGATLHSVVYCGARVLVRVACCQLDDHVLQQGAGRSTILYWLSQVYSALADKM